MERLQDGSTAKTLLSKSPTIEADFTLHPDANPVSRQKSLVRWQLNPQSDWGPKPRATRKMTTGVDESSEVGSEVDRHRVQKRKAEKHLEV